MGTDFAPFAGFVFDPTPLVMGLVIVIGILGYLMTRPDSSES